MGFSCVKGLATNSPTEKANSYPTVRMPAKVVVLAIASATVAVTMIVAVAVAATVTTPPHMILVAILMMMATASATSLLVNMSTSKYSYGCDDCITTNYTNNILAHATIYIIDVL